MGTFTEKELVEILNKYGTLSDNNEETILDKILTTSDKRHEIKVSEIWDNSFDKEKVIFTLEIKGFGGNISSNIYGPFEKEASLTWQEFIKEFTDNTDYFWNDTEFSAAIGGFTHGNGYLLFCGSNSSTAGIWFAPILDTEGENVKLDDIITSR